MPMAPKKGCVHPGCPVLLESGGKYSRCPAHQKKLWKEKDANRPTFTQRGYVARLWQPLRVAALVRDGWRCQGKDRDGKPCRWTVDLVEAYQEAGMGLPSTNAVLESLKVRYNAKQRHLVVDHRLTAEARPDLMYELSNLQVLCSTCHNAKTMRDSVSPFTRIG